MNRLKKLTGGFVFIAALLSAPVAQAQRVALKTNALYWAALAPNLSAEFRMSRHFSLNIDGAVNPGLENVTKIFLKDNKTTEVALLSPEVRYWFSARPHAGHFVGAMALGSIYKLRYDGMGHEGDALAVGLTYGYSFVLNRRWSIEGTVGAGAVRLREKKWAEGSERPDKINRKSTVLAPLKVGISVVYILK